MIYLFRKQIFKPSIFGTIDGMCQELLVSDVVIQHIRRYRQLCWNSKEAGGQLFGMIELDKICVAVAVGPHKGDERSRYRYRSNPIAAQRAIDKKSKQGYLYLGEWHTHAEDCPNASSMDNDAMCQLIVNSHLNSNSLLMLIIGKRLDISGIGVWVVSHERVRKWNIRELRENN